MRIELVHNAHRLAAVRKLKAAAGALDAAATFMAAGGLYQLARVTERQAKDLVEQADRLKERARAPFDPAQGDPDRMGGPSCA